MTRPQSMMRCLGFAALCLLSGCVGRLIGGGTPDSLYRFGIADSAAAECPSDAQRPTLLIEKLHFAQEIDGDRLLAVHAGTARYIKGVRWVTGVPGLFGQALMRGLQTDIPAYRVTMAPRGANSGYAVAITIDRFDAHYPDPAMRQPPTIAVSGDATLYALPAHSVIAQRHFVTQALARDNRADAIVAAFDRATGCYTATIAQWITATASPATPLAPPATAACAVVS